MCYGYVEDGGVLVRDRYRQNLSLIEPGLVMSRESSLEGG
jgi:hypothetical protein